MDKEIKWNLINSGIAGFLVFIGATISEFADHGFSEPKELLLGAIIGLLTSLVVAVTKFKDYWDGEKKEYSQNVFRFL